MEILLGKLPGKLRFDYGGFPAAVIKLKYTSCLCLEGFFLIVPLQSFFLFFRQEINYYRNFQWPRLPIKLLLRPSTLDENFGSDVVILRLTIPDRVNKRIAYKVKRTFLRALVQNRVTFLKLKFTTPFCAAVLK